MGAIHYKVFDEGGRTVSRTIYNVLGLDKEGRKDVLGMYISKSEGVEDILIACIDSLSGFAEAIESVFSEITAQ